MESYENTCRKAHTNRSIVKDIYLLINNNKKIQLKKSEKGLILIQNINSQRICPHITVCNFLVNYISFD